MLVSGVTVDSFVSVVEMISRTRYAGNVKLVYTPSPLNAAGTRFRVALRAESSRNAGARRTTAGRRSVAACWHVFRNVYAELFRLHPDAVVRTSMATYKGAAGFESNYPATAYQNIGTQLYPATMLSLCDCGGTLPSRPQPAPQAAASVRQTLHAIDDTLNWHDAYCQA